MIFETMFAQLAAKPSTEIKAISTDNYEKWKKLFTFEALKNQRYGQSFCNYFNITDNRIFYERDWSRCDRIIRKEWLARA
jgi:hypothetical protein